MEVKDRLNKLHEAQNAEDLILHKVSLQKTKMMKKILGQLIRKRELELARGPFADWYEQVFVVPFSERFGIPIVDRTLQDCQQLLYLHNQHKTVLKNKIRSYGLSRENDENDLMEISNLKRERERLEYLLQNHTADLHGTNAEVDNLYRHLKRLEAECQRLIQGGVEVVEYEEDTGEPMGRMSRLR